MRPERKQKKPVAAAKGVQTNSDDARHPVTQSGDSFIDLCARRRLILFCGSGGVGKTTVAAATALALAKRGKRVIVMTIDPARRLMDALGLPRSGTDPITIPLERLGTVEENSHLEALMLYPRETIDALLQKFAPTRDIFEGVKNNRVYKVASDSLAGSVEYIALGKLYELTKEEYDHIIVDTAPTQYALDFFEAPENLINILDARILKFLLLPFESMRGKGPGLLTRGAGMVFGTLEKALGFNFLEDISNFLRMFEGMYGQFRDRALSVHEILMDENETQFHVVGVPSSTSLNDSVHLFNSIFRLKMPPGGYLLNRIHPSFPVDEEAMTGMQKSLDEQAQGLMSLLKQQHELVEAMSMREQQRIRSAQESLHEDTPVYLCPYFSEDIADLERLDRMGTMLSQATCLSVHTKEQP